MPFQKINSLHGLKPPWKNKQTADLLETAVCYQFSHYGKTITNSCLLSFFYFGIVKGLSFVQKKER